MKKRRAVFLDRDGTINEDVGYIESYARIHIYSYSFEAVRRINESGLMAIVVSNQSGVGRGIISEKDLLIIHDRMKAAFEAKNARLDAIYYCPHDPSSAFPELSAPCDCRKPLPGMAREAQAAFDLDLSGSYMVGDKVEDIRFGLNIGVEPILVLTGYGRKSLDDLNKAGLRPACVVPDLKDAVDWILRRENERSGGF